MYNTETAIINPSDLLYDSSIDAWSAVTKQHTIIVIDKDDTFYKVEGWASSNMTAVPDMSFSVRKDSYTPPGSITLSNIINSFDLFIEEYN